MTPDQTDPTNIPGPNPPDSSQARGRYQKGVSGNRKGRPLGSRNRTTLACEALLEGEAEQLTRKAIEMGLAGEKAVLRLCLERIIPVRHERPIAADLPELSAATTTADKLEVVVKATADGRLLPSQAETLAKLLEAQAKARELEELHERVSALEQLAREAPKS